MVNARTLESAIVPDIARQWTTSFQWPIMITCTPPEEEIRSYKKISRKLRRENNTPEKARALLLRYGILEKHKKSLHGVRLAKRFR